MSLFSDGTQPEHNSPAADSRQRGPSVYAHGGILYDRHLLVASPNTAMWLIDRILRVTGSALHGSNAPGNSVAMIDRGKLHLRLVPGERLKEAAAHCRLLISDCVSVIDEALPDSTAQTAIAKIIGIEIVGQNIERRGRRYPLTKVNMLFESPEIYDEQQLALQTAHDLAGIGPEGHPNDTAPPRPDIVAMRIGQGPGDVYSHRGFADALVQRISDFDGVAEATADFAALPPRPVVDAI